MLNKLARVIVTGRNTPTRTAADVIVFYVWSRKNRFSMNRYFKRHRAPLVSNGLRS